MQCRTGNISRSAGAVVGAQTCAPSSSSQHLLWPDPGRLSMPVMSLINCVSTLMFIIPRNNLNTFPSFHYRQTTSLFSCPCYDANCYTDDRTHTSCTCH